MKTEDDDAPVSKGQFAKLIGVHRRTLQKYLRDGKIDGRAVVGTGRRALIRPRVAMEQLRQRLDPIRVRANINDERVAGVRVAQPSALRREQLRGLRLRNRAKEREEHRRAAELVRAASVRPVMLRLIEQTANIIDDDEATKIAERFCRLFGLPPEQARPWLVEEFRRVREQVRRRGLALLGGPHANGGRPPNG